MKTTVPRFRVPMTEEQTDDLLTASYMAEVEFRHRKYVNDEETKKNISRFAKYLTSENKKFGVMFCGICGNGKTTLLYAFQSVVSLLNKNGAFEDKKTGVRIVDAKELAQYAKDLIQFRDLKDCPIIAIDDMGREAAEVLDFGNVLNPMIDLIEYRYNLQLFTIITTNLTGEQVREKYGGRIADRFNEMLEVIIFRNTTYRK